MKRLKRMMVFTIVTALVINMLAVVNVSAAVKRLDNFWFDMLYDDVITLSMDFKKTEAESYGLEFTAAKNPDNPKDFTGGTYYGQGWVRLTTDNHLAINETGTSIPISSENASSLTRVPFDMGIWNNLKVKMDRIDYLVEWYLNDTYVTSTPISTDTPMNAVSIFVEDYISSGCEIRFVSVSGSKKGYMGANIDGVDEENKTITVSFSEKPSSYDFGNSVTMKPVNSLLGGEEALALLSYDGSVFVFKYEGELKNSNEYAVVFPEGIKGVNGGKLYNRCYYFTTDSAYEAKILNMEDYNDGSASVAVNQPSGATLADLIVDTGEAGYGKAMRVRKTIDGDEVVWWNGFVPPTDALSSISFDIKPLMDEMQFCIHFMDGQNEGIVPIGMAFGKTGYIASDRNGWPLKNWTTYAYTNNDWSVQNSVGTYQKDQWVNIKLEFDMNKRVVNVYKDGDFAKQIESTSMNQYNRFGRIRFWIPSEMGAAGTELMWLDNIKTEKYETPLTVKKLRFTDIEGKETGAYEVLDRRLDEINISFSDSVNEETVNSSSVRLKYDGEDVSYTGEYTESGYVYIMKPSVLPPKNARITVEISGVEDINGTEIQKYEAYAEADDADDDFKIENFEFVSQDDTVLTELDGNEAYLNTVIVNTTPEDKEIVVTILGYNDAALEQMMYEKVTVSAGSVYKTEKRLFADTSSLDEIRATVTDGETGQPIINDIYICHEERTEGEISFVSESGAVLSGNSVTVEVYAPECEFDDLETASDFRDVLVYKTQLTANGDGIYQDSFTINYPDAVSGMYTVQTYAEDYSNTYRFLYVNPQKAEAVFDTELKPALKSGDAEAVASVITENQFDLYIDDKYLDAEVAARAAELLISENAKEEITFENLKTVMNKAVAVAAYEKDKISDILAEGDIFNLKDTKIKDVYQKDFVKANTKAEIEERLGDKVFESIDAFDSALEEAFVLAVVENPNVPNSAEVTLKAYGVSGNKAGVYDAISGKRYDTYEDLLSAIDNYKAPANTGGGSGGGGGGGSSSGGSSGGIGMISIPAETAETETSEKETEAVYVLFTDLSPALWAEAAINALAKKGIVSGKEYKKFYPTDNVTREEFTKMLTLAFEVAGEADIHSFEDVMDGAWYSDYIARAYLAGIVTGKSAVEFGIGENITRQDMAVMIYRAALRNGVTFNADTAVNFADDTRISEYAREGVYALKTAGIISGKENNCFAPSDFATRAEAAQMIYMSIR